MIKHMHQEYLYILTYITLLSILSTKGTPLGIDHLPLESFVLNNNSKSASSLSELIRYRYNSTIEYIPFPSRPNCDKLLDVEEKQYAVSISTWKIDLENKNIPGVLFWQEAVTTTCTFSFFGAKTRVTQGSDVIPFGTLLPEIEIANFMSNQIDEIVEFPELGVDDRFDCYYCWNDYKHVYHRNLYKHVLISRFPEGDIRSPLGSWSHISRNMYTDGKRYLYVHKADGVEFMCPFIIHEIRYGVLSLSKSDTMIISIPSIKQQYSIPEGSDHMTCKKGEANYILWHTAGGYIISFSGQDIPTSPNVLAALKQKGNTTRGKRSIEGGDILRFRYSRLFQKNRSRNRRETNYLEFSSHLRSDLTYAQFRFEIDFVLRQINKNLILIQNNICESILQRWIMLYPPDLPRKIAQYNTHSLFSLGEFKDNIYKITSTVDTGNPIDLIIPLIRINGMYKTIDQHKNTTLWLEPITGILFLSPHWTHYSMVASWVPIGNGSGIDPLTGRIVSSETMNSPLTLIEQTAAYYPKTLYTQGSLAGIIEDNSFYNSPSSTDQSSSITTSWWSPYVIHFVMSIVTLLMSLILIPAIMKLLSRCAEKGEEILERTLKLSPDPLIPGRNRFQ